MDGSSFPALALRTKEQAAADLIHNAWAWLSATANTGSMMTHRHGEG